MRRAALGAVCALAVAAPAAARTGTRPFSVAVRGTSLTLAFHGDPATGCAQRGLCDTSGTITVTRKGKGVAATTLAATTDAVFGFVLGTGGTTTQALVKTTGAPDCSDTSKSSFLSFSVASFGGPVLVGYGSTGFAAPSPGEFSIGSSDTTDPFGSRCAGPVPDDDANALPVAHVKRSLLRHGTFRADLSGTRSFAHGGFAGTVTSDYVLTFHRMPCKGRTARRNCRAFDRAIG
jgi:hypothetical protein